MHASADASFYTASVIFRNAATASASQPKLIYMVTTMGYLGKDGGAYTARPQRPALLALQIS